MELTVSKLLRIIMAAVASIIAGIATVILLGVLLPVWTMVLVYGEQEVLDSPGNGSVILLLTLPVAGMIAILSVIPVGQFVYRRLSKSNSETIR